MRRWAGLADLVLLRSRHRRPVDLLLLTALLAPMFLVVSRASAGGAFPGYLFPLYTVLPVLLVAPLGPGRRWERLRAAGMGVLVLVVAGQSAWLARQREREPTSYSQPVPTERFPAVVEALAAAGVRTAYADYWVAYPLQFLAGDGMVVNPIYTERFPELSARAAADPAPSFIVPEGEPADRLRQLITDAGSVADEHHAEGLVIFTGIEPGLGAPLPQAVYDAIHPAPG